MLHYRNINNSIPTINKQWSQIVKSQLEKFLGNLCKTKIFENFVLNQSREPFEYATEVIPN